MTIFNSYVKLPEGNHYLDPPSTNKHEIKMAVRHVLAKFRTLTILFRYLEGPGMYSKWGMTGGLLGEILGMYIYINRLDR